MKTERPCTCQRCGIQIVIESDVLQRLELCSRCAEENAAAFCEETKDQLKMF
jgi:hypothetical protein